MNILSYVRKYNFLLLLTAIPLLSHAQNPFERQVDSMKQAFKRMDSIRRQSGPRDTIKNELVRSPSVIIYDNVNAAKSIVAGVQQLSLQALRFRSSHYWSLVLRAGLIKPVFVNGQNKLYLLSADNTSIALNCSGRAVSKGTEKRNSSELRLAYNLTEDDFKFLISKKVISIKVDYVGGEWMVPINNDGSEQIKKACMLTQ